MNKFIGNKYDLSQARISFEMFQKQNPEDFGVIGGVQNTYRCVVDRYYRMLDLLGKNDFKHLDPSSERTADEMQRDTLIKAKQLAFKQGCDIIENFQTNNELSYIYFRVLHKDISRLFEFADKWPPVVNDKDKKHKKEWLDALNSRAALSFAEYNFSRILELANCDDPSFIDRFINDYPVDSCNFKFNTYCKVRGKITLSFLQHVIEGDDDHKKRIGRINRDFHTTGSRACSNLLLRYIDVHATNDNFEKIISVCDELYEWVSFVSHNLPDEISISPKDLEKMKKYLDKEISGGIRRKYNRIAGLEKDIDQLKHMLKKYHMAQPDKTQENAQKPKPSLP